MKLQKTKHGWGGRGFDAHTGRIPLYLTILGGLAFVLVFGAILARVASEQAEEWKTKRSIGGMDYSRYER